MIKNVCNEELLGGIIKLINSDRIIKYFPKDPFFKILYQNKLTNKRLLFYL